jgi:hypothetical protein
MIPLGQCKPSVFKLTLQSLLLLKKDVRLNVATSDQLPIAY